MDKWFAPARFAVLVGCLIAACFPGVIAGAETFFFRDFAIFSYPLAAYHRDCFWRGELPLWNPYNDCGLPFLAQWNTMVLYPLSLIYLLFPLPWSLNVFCLAHMFLAAVGMYFLARSWTRDNFAGAVAGIGFIFGGVFLSCLKWPNNTAALGWMPWVVLAVDRALAGGWRNLGLASLVGAIQMLAGAPEIILLTWIFCGVLACWHFFSASKPKAVVVLRFGIIIALVTGLAAAQLLPFLELIGQSQRGENFAASQWPMPIWGWANFFAPLFRTFRSYHGVHAQPGQYWISTYYVSLPLVVLAMVALVRVRSGRLWLLWSLLVFVLWMALGPRALLYAWLREIVPGLGLMRFPIKFVVLAAFIFPLLAAFGVAHITRVENWKQVRLAVILPAGLLLLIIFGLILNAELVPFPISQAIVVSKNAVIRGIFLIAGGACLIFLGRTLPGKKQIPAGILLLVVVLDALTHAPWQNPTAPASVYDGSVAELSPPVHLGRSRAMISPEAYERVDHLPLKNPAEDVLASRLSLYCNMNLIEKAPKVDGFYALYPRHTAEVQNALYRDPTNVPPTGILNFLAVSQISAPGTWKDWKTRSEALPLINSPEIAVTSSNVLAEILSPIFDPKKVAYVSADLPQKVHTGGASIRDVNWQAEHISFQSTTDQPGFVVISQSSYPPWKATVNGQPAELFRVNHAFQGLIVPAGSHTVVLRYRDRGFQLGSFVSVFSAMIVTVMLLFGGRQTA